MEGYHAELNPVGQVGSRASKPLCHKGIQILAEKIDNYTVWQAQVKSRLKRLEAWERVQSKLKPADVDRKEWNKAEYAAIDTIRTYLGGTILNDTIDIEDPHELWEKVARIFTNRTGAEKSLVLSKLFRCVMHEDENPNEYLRRFANIRAKCREIGWKFDDVFYAIRLADGLTQQFHPIQQLLMAKGDNITYEEAYEVISVEGLKQETKDDVVDKGLKVKDGRRKYAKGSASWTTKNKRCNFCNEKGHLQKFCHEYNTYRKKFAKKNKKNGKNMKKNKKKDSSDSESSDEALCVDSDNTSMNSDYNYLHSALGSEDVFKASQDRCAKSTAWIADSGATCDMSYDLTCFSSMKPAHGRTC